MKALTRETHGVKPQRRPSKPPVPQSSRAPRVTKATTRKSLHAQDYLIHFDKICRYESLREADEKSVEAFARLLAKQIIESYLRNMIHEDFSHTALSNITISRDLNPRLYYNDAGKLCHGYLPKFTIQHSSIPAARIVVATAKDEQTLVQRNNGGEWLTVKHLELH